MKIEGPRVISSPGATRRTGAASASGFSVGVSETAAPAASSTAAAVTPLDVILALQSEEPPAQRRARQLKRGDDALNALERLEEGLLTGRAPAALRRELEVLQRGAQLTGEAGLDEVLREIDTRLAVELAKLERLGRVECCGAT